MYRVLYLLSALSGGYGAIAIFQAPTITQQTAALVILMISAVLLSGAVTAQAILHLKNVDTMVPGQKTHEDQVRAIAESWNKSSDA